MLMSLRRLTRGSQVQEIAAQRVAALPAIETTKDTGDRGTHTPASTGFR